MDQVVEDLLSCLDDPALALLQWNEAFGVVQVCSPSQAPEMPWASCMLVIHSQAGDSSQCAAQPVGLSRYLRPLLC